MSLSLILMMVCIVGFCVTIALAASSQGQAVDNVALKERLAALTSQPDAAAREIDLGIKREQSKMDLKKVVQKFTGEAYLQAVEKELTQASIPMRVSEFIMLRVILVFVGFAFCQYFTGNYGYSLIAAAVMFVVHIPVIKIKKIMRINKFVEQLAEFLVLITNSLRAGQTFLQGVDIASKESPNPIAEEFRLLLKETNLGMPVEESFNNMLVRIPSEDLKIVMSAFTIQRNVGGNLADIMDQVAAMIRQRIQIQGQIRVLTTQGKLSGAIVGLLPFGLLIVFSFIDFRYTSLLWTRTEGQIMFGLMIFMELLGCFVIYKICDIEV